MSELSTPARVFMCGAVCALLSACNAGTAGTPSLPSQPSLAIRATPSVTPRTAKVTIEVRRQGVKSTAGPIEPQYVSPSAKSMVVRVINTSPAITAFVNINASARPNVSFNAPIGSDEFNVALYDAPQSKSGGKPNGKLLGQVELVETVASNGKNRFVVVPNGIVRSVSVTPVANQVYLETVDSGYAIVGQHSAVFVVTPRDADGNAIVPPGIQPSISLQTAAKNTYFAAIASSQPSRFTIVVTAQAPPGTRAGFIARATDARNVTVARRFTIMQRSEVFVSYANGKILAFDDQGNALTLGTKAFTGLARPVALAYDTADLELFAADATTGVVDGFTSEGASLPGFTPAALTGVNGVTWNSGGNLAAFAASSPASAIINDVHNGAAVESPFDVTAGGGIAYMPSSEINNYYQQDLLLVSDQSTGELDAYTPYGGEVNFGLQNVTVGPPSGTPGAIAVDPQGTVAWVSGTAASGGELWRLPLLASSPPESAIPDGDGPAGVAYDPSIDRLFVANSSSGEVVAYLSDLSAVDSSIVLIAPASSGAGNPEGVAVAY
jgi:hypothetical protein